LNLLVGADSTCPILDRAADFIAKLGCVERKCIIDLVTMGSKGCEIDPTQNVAGTLPINYFGALMENCAPKRIAVGARKENVLAVRQNALVLLGKIAIEPASVTGLGSIS
jgi:hypothetical protein